MKLADIIAYVGTIVLIIYLVYEIRNGNNPYRLFERMNLNINNNTSLYTSLILLLKPSLYFMYQRRLFSLLFTTFASKNII